MKTPPNRTRPARLRACLALSIHAALHAALWLPAAQAAPPAWRDHATGLALAGTDPLSYLTEGEPRQGEPELEYEWRGTFWRFVNTGNRAAFVRHPQVYAPTFAGYDAYALARGAPVPGHPTIWALHGGQVYLFRSQDNLRRWSADRDGVNARARQQWSRLGATLPEQPQW